MAKIDRAALRQKIQQLEGLTDDERAALLELAATKRYGLVWEEREEAVEERLRDELPVLIEDKELALTDGGKEAPNHILIEGDNLEAALEQIDKLCVGSTLDFNPLNTLPPDTALCEGLVQGVARLYEKCITDGDVDLQTSWDDDAFTRPNGIFFG